MIIDLQFTVCAMILGLNIYRECAADVEFVRYSMYTVSATIGAVMTVIAFYNIYAVNYSTRKYHNSNILLCQN